MPDHDIEPLASALGPTFRISVPYRARTVYVSCRRCPGTWLLPKSALRDPKPWAHLRRHDCQPWVPSHPTT